MTFHTNPLLFSVPFPLRRQLPLAWFSGFLITCYLATVHPRLYGPPPHHRNHLHPLLYFALTVIRLAFAALGRQR